MNFFLFSQTIQIRLILQFLTTMANMSVTPYLVIFFSSQLGTIMTGWMFLGVMAANIAGSFTGGYTSDRTGRKNVVILSEAMVFIGFLSVASVNSPWISLPYATFVIFVFIHFFIGMAAPAYQAMIIDESSPDNRKAIYTFSYWLQNLAVAIGGIIGAFLFKEHHFLLFIGVAFFTLISLLITFFFIKETYKPAPINTMTRNNLSFFAGWSSYLQVIKNKTFIALALANLLIVAIEEQLTNFIGLRLAEDIAQPEQLLPFLALKVDGINLLGILKTENTILVVCLTVLVTYLLKKFNDRSVLLSGLVLYFIGYTVLSFHDSAIVLLLAMFIATLGELMHIPVKQTLLANMVPDHARSSYMAVFGLMTIVGVMTAGVFIFLSSFLPTIVLSCLFLLMGTASITIFARLTSKDRLEKSNSLPSQLGS